MKLFVVLMMLGLALPIVSSGWSEQSSAANLTDAQRAGRRLFVQNCSFCHSPKNKNPKSTAQGTTIGPVLNGLFQGQKPLSEQAVRTFILRGVPQKMPGFQYGLDSKEVDAIVAYLKTL